MTFEILQEQPSSPRPTSLQLRSNKFPPYSNLNADYIVKLIVLGNTGVGKTSFLYALNKRSVANYTTIGVDMITKYVMNKDKVIKAHIWDTAGQECFRSIITSYYRTVCGGFLVFDLSRIHTLYDLEKWIEESRKYLPEQSKEMFVLVGTKTDIFIESKDIEQVRTKAKAFSKKYNIPYIECSPKKQENTDNAFIACIEMIWKRFTREKREKREKEWIGIKEIHHEPDLEHITLENSSFKYCCL